MCMLWFSLIYPNVYVKDTNGHLTIEARFTLLVQKDTRTIHFTATNKKRCQYQQTKSTIFITQLRVHRIVFYLKEIDINVLDPFSENGVDLRIN